MSDAQTFIQIGKNALAESDSIQARAWFLQAFDAATDRHDLADACRWVAKIYRDEEDYARSRIWFLRALEAERGHRGSGAIQTCVELGNLARAEDRFHKALVWYELALLLKPRGCHFVDANYQLAALHERRSQNEVAERHYRIVVGMPSTDELTERIQARAWHQLGRLAESGGDFGLATERFRRALVIKERFGDVASIAMTRHQMSVVHTRAEQFETAARWALKAASGFCACSEWAKAGLAARVFVNASEKLEASEREELAVAWETAGLDSAWLSNG